METTMMQAKPSSFTCTMTETTIQETATGTSRHALQLPGDDIDETQVNVLLQDFEFSDTRVRIGQLIRRERHSDVYSVFLDEDGSRLDKRAVARAFIIDEVPGKLRRHRARCINRLRNRALLITSFRGAMVMVNEIDHSEEEDATDPLGYEKGHELETNLSLSEEELAVIQLGSKEPAKRVRQRERRRLDRKIKAENTTMGVIWTLDNIRPSDVPKTPRTLKHLLRAYSIYDYRGDQRRDVKGRDLSPLIGDIMKDDFELRSWELFEDGFQSEVQQENQFNERVKPLRDSLRDLLNDQTALLKILKQTQEELSEMSYQQLSSGLEDMLSQIPREEINMDSRNHRLEILRYAQVGLPNLRRRVEEQHKVTEERYKKWLVREVTGNGNPVE